MVSRRFSLTEHDGEDLSGDQLLAAELLLSGDPASDRPRDRRAATTIAMVVATISVTIGDLFMSEAMRGLGPLSLPAAVAWWKGELSFLAFISQLPAELFSLIILIFSSVKVWLAIGFMLTFLVLWMVSLSWSDLTFVMPLTAITYVLNALLVGPVLGEEVTATRWLGTLLIAGGVLLVTLEQGKITEH